MLPAKLLLDEIIVSLREVIGPAISEPYPKAQAYMAATILEFVSRQIEERGDVEAQKTAIIRELFDDLRQRLGTGDAANASTRDEAAVCEVIERLHAARAELGERAFEAADQRVRRALRQLLDLELRVAGKAGE
jgi:hypothetical protein